MEWAVELVALLVKTGPFGAVVAAVVVGLALVIIIIAQISGIFADRREAVKRNGFQDQLLEAVKMLTESEATLRAENAALREELGQVSASVELLREQQRRTIDLLRRVMDGSLAPSAITASDIPGAPA